MFQRVLIVSLLTLLAPTSFAAAGDVVEVRVLEDDRPSDQNRPAGELPTDPPKNAKTVLSIESLVGAHGDFHAKCVIDGKTVRLKGRVIAAEDGKRRLSVDFSLRSQGGGQQVTTNVILRRDKERILSGLASTGDSGALLVAARIKADDGADDGIAE